jgi:hypothetical protein
MSPVESTTCARTRLASFVLPLAPMRCRRLTLLIALFVTLDLTNPFIGCAFNFNAEESMDGISRQHERHVRQAAVMVLPTPSGGDSSGLTRSEGLRAPRSRALSEWFGQLRQAHAPHSEPQSATEDH